jgi:hypothetical protein
MIKGIANIIEWIRYNETENWRIKSSEKGVLMFSSPDNETITVDDTILLLQKRVEMLEPGVYYIEAYKHHQPRNTWCYTRFVITGSSQGSPGENFMPAVSGFTKDQVHEEITRALTEYQIKTENERLKQENAELKSKQESISLNIADRFIKYEPYLGALLNKFFPDVKPAQQVAISGLQKIENMPIGEYDDQTIEMIINEWYQLDKDAILLMQYFIKLKKVNPAMYEQAKSIISNMFKNG